MVISVVRSALASSPRVIRPSWATLIRPVSSLTMSTTASLCSVRPTAARWRVPMRPTPGMVSASGSTQPAATSRASRMITAPSCSEVPGMKMVASISAVTSPLMRTPVAAMFSRPVSRSNTTSAPVLRSLSDDGRADHLVDGALRVSPGVLAEQRAHRPEPAHLVERAAQLGLEEDDRRDDDRLAAVGEDELQQAEVERLGGQADAR